MVGLNILALILFLVMLVGLASVIKNLGRNLHNAKLKRIIAVYVAILLLSAVIICLMPENNFIITEQVTPEEREEAELASRLIYDAAQKGKIEQVKGVHVKGRWSFQYTGNQVKIAVEDQGIWIIAERKAVNDGKIEVVSYLSTTILDDINFTEQIEAPRISLIGDKLIVKIGAPFELVAVRFKKEFTINQFLEEGANLGQHSTDNVMGRQLLFLRIPQNLQVDHGKSGIQFVEKDL